EGLVLLEGGVGRARRRAGWVRLRTSVLEFPGVSKTRPHPLRLPRLERDPQSLRLISSRLGFRSTRKLSPEVSGEQYFSGSTLPGLLGARSSSFGSCNRSRLERRFALSTFSNEARVSV